MSNRLGGKQGTAYTGTNANQPPNWTFNDRPPTQYDNQNVSEGDLWLDSSATHIERVWVLVSLAGNAMSKGVLAEWVQLGSGSLESLTGNSGGAVFPDASSNINVIGDTTTIDVVGNPGTNTLTVSTVGSGVVNSLTGNSGGAVFPTAGNINVLGTGVISVVGNPGTSTLTVTPSGDIASSFITNPATGTATPVSGVLTFAGTGDVTVSAAGSTVTINGSGSGTITGLLAQDGNTVTPTAGVIQVSGANGLTTTGTVGPNTLTINYTSISKFGAYLSSTASDVTGDGTDYTIIFDTEIYDDANNYNNGTGVFTAPVAGIYNLSSKISLQQISDQTLCGFNITTTGTYANTYTTWGVSPVNVKRGDNVMTCDVSLSVRMDAGDTAHISISIGGGGNAKTIDVIGLNGASYFSGFLVH